MADERFIRPGDGFPRLIEETGELSKELGDLTAALGKTVRFGADSVNPLLPPEQQETNAAWIERAIRNVQREYADWLQAVTKYHREVAGEAANVE